MTRSPTQHRAPALPWTSGRARNPGKSLQGGCLLATAIGQVTADCTVLPPGPAGLWGVVGVPPAQASLLLAKADPENGSLSLEGVCFPDAEASRHHLDETSRRAKCPPAKRPRACQSAHGDMLQTPAVGFPVETDPRDETDLSERRPWGPRAAEACLDHSPPPPRRRCGPRPVTPPP